MKKLTLDDLKTFRDRLYLDIPDKALEENPYLPPYFRPEDKSDEMEYLHERRRALGGYLPSRNNTVIPLQIPGPERFGDVKRGSGKQKIATTMAFVRLLKDIMKDREFGKRWVPIIPDEARTFGMDSLFPTAEDLLAARAELHAGRPGAVPVLQGGHWAARSCTRASTRRARWRRSPPPAAPTPRTASR